MKYTQVLFLILLISLFAVHIYFEQKQAQIPKPSTPPGNWEKVLAYAQQNLPHQGVLTRKSDGYVYLKVDDNYIHQLFPMLKLNKTFHKPPNFRQPEAPGAHITVFYSDEHINPKTDLGRVIPFTVKGIRLVHPNRYTSFIVLEVDAPELEQIRKKYGRNPKINGNEFHISIAKRQT